MCSFSYSVRSGISVDISLTSISTQKCDRTIATKTPRHEKTTRGFVISRFRGYGTALNACVSDDVIERVALERNASGGRDEALDLPGGHRLRRARTGHVVNLLFLHGAVEIVGAEPQRRLRHFHAGRD